MSLPLLVGYLILTALYLAALAAYGGQFYQGESWRPRLTRALLLALVSAHALFLVGLGAAYGELPLVCKENVFSALALSLLLVHGMLEVRFGVRTTGVFAVGAATLLHWLSWRQVAVTPPIREILRDPFFGFHIASAILGYTAFVVSATYGALYLALHRAIKARRFGLVWRRFPALDLLSRMNAHAAVAGFVFLGLSLVAGMGLSRRLDVAFLGDPTFLQSVVAWAGYGVFVALFYGARWRGPRLAYLSLGCFALTLVSVAWVLLMYRGFHTFG